MVGPPYIEDAMDYLAEKFLTRHSMVRGVSLGLTDDRRRALVIFIDANHCWDVNQNLPKGEIPENVPYLENFMDFPVVYRRDIMGRVKGRH